MRSFTPKQREAAKSIILDLFISAGVTPNTRPLEYCENSYSLLNEYNGAEYKPDAVEIVNFMCRRTFNFGNVDAAIQRIIDGDIRFGKNVNSVIPDYALNLSDICSAIAYTCAKYRIFWDDDDFTVDEIDNLRTENVSAQTLWDFNCFASQPDTPVSSGRAASSGIPGAPKSGYKSAGPQSKNVVGLVSEPGSPERLSGQVFSIVADAMIDGKPSKITPTAFIHPVNNPEYHERARVDGDMPIVYLGAGNGYTDLAIYSTDESKMLKIVEAFKTMAIYKKYQNIRVVKAKTAACGYYAVKTAYGVMYIKPTKLNEAGLAESLEEDIDDIIEIEPKRKIINMKEFIRDSKMYD